MNARIPLLVASLPIAAPAAPIGGGAWGQGSDEVRLAVKSGAIARLPIRCEALQGPASGPASSHDADEVLAADLQASAVFAVDRAWAPAASDPEPQFVSSGRWAVSGSEARLSGELRDY